ncbi:hypothetical protein EV361DRAFT_812702 [Lentinula raphanica]|nr:hypothetical protein F5880DRAFT_1487152 [Lentinula raphanica]KAJ3964051.1 hypothetical protein EV361DRAFT_812702 [Lentinula raphanica]
MEEDVAGGNFEPFWEGFPLTDIHLCIAPDVLHQLYQGVFKYLVKWVQHVIGEDELDDRLRKLPPAPGVRHFAKGISNLAQMSGTERKQIARVLLSCLVGKMDSRGITACRSILHFIELSQYPSHDEDTLDYMKKELDTWLEYRDYFIDQGARKHFNIPKFHSLLHYIDSIRWTGTTDNTNTEAFERLHIEFAKEGWRASNKRDHFPQMVSFISRQEKISSFDFYRLWTEANAEDVPNSQEDLFQNIREKSSSVLLSLAKNPTEPKKKLTAIAILHGAPGFLGTLKLFLNDFILKSKRKKADALEGILPFPTLDVWHNFGLVPPRILDEPEKALIKARPLSSKGRCARFDTVLVLERDEAQSTAVRGKEYSFRNA